MMRYNKLHKSDLKKGNFVKMNKNMIPENHYEEGVFSILSIINGICDSSVDIGKTFSEKCEIFGHTKSGKFVPDYWFIKLSEIEMLIYKRNLKLKELGI